ncbi:hypothetical protein V6N13_061245 [Hibiscus sabdariffa]|uniref:Uncharacterized protein n=1 Tax=Hibiscus sabdariffa TaxID=183260 RepID=A0ABR2EFY8_9ROSI
MWVSDQTSDVGYDSRGRPPGEWGCVLMVRSESPMLVVSPIVVNPMPFIPDIVSGPALERSALPLISTYLRDSKKARSDAMEEIPQQALDGKSASPVWISDALVLDATAASVMTAVAVDAVDSSLQTGQARSYASIVYGAQNGSGEELHGVADEEI